MYKLTLVILVLLIASTHMSTSVAAAAVAASPIAKTGCKDHCGNVSIPYPFGIGPKCYHNPWFEIECTDQNTFMLKALNVSLNLQGMTDYDHPIGTQINWLLNERTLTMGFDCQGYCKDASNPEGSGPVFPFDLRKSPFVYSSTRNVLLVAGCGGDVVLKNTRNETLAGCAQVCTNGSESTIYKHCYGIGCCQTTIPFSLDYFWLDFLVTPGLKEPKNAKVCSWPTYAVLVDSSWIFDKVIDSHLSRLGCPNVPVIWEWIVTDLPVHSAGYENATCRRDGAGAGAGAGAGGYLCRCKAEYFEGNPYMPYGCQVVKECEGCPEECIFQGNGSTFSCPQMNDQQYANVVDVQKTWLIVGLVLGSSLALLFLLMCGYWLRRFLNKKRDTKLKAKYFERNGGTILKQQLSTDQDNNIDKARIFSSTELDKATDQYNKNRVLGTGGQATVYKGMLSDGNIVAIKKFKIKDEKQLNNFINEVILLSQIRHRNVVKLLGCCLETEVPLLVYEYVPNGTLSQQISSPNYDLPIPFKWEMRLVIAIDVANALAYLHSSSLLPIFHRDIKSSNILLDSKYRAKLADFGISKSVTIDQTHVTTQIIGTFGYLDPEYFQSRQFTDKSDVYGFGVVLVELLTGQIADKAMQHDRGLVPWFIEHLLKSSLYEILDEQVSGEGGKEEIIAVANLAKRCLSLDGKSRPSMMEVAAELETIRSVQQGWTAKNTTNITNMYDDDDDLAVSRMNEQFHSFSRSSTIFYTSNM